MPYPVLKVSEMKLDFDIKEFRLAEMQRTVNPKTAASAVLQAMHELADEVKIEGKMAWSVSSFYLYDALTAMVKPPD